MPADDFESLRCSECGHSESIAWERILERVRETGKLRRSAEPSRELVLEVIRDQPPTFACDRCGRLSLTLALFAGPIESTEADAWETEKRCQACHGAIDPDRLEVFPDSSRCTSCQSQFDQSPDEGSAEFCARCGGLLTMKQSRGSGISRYQMSCNDCGNRQ